MLAQRVSKIGQAAKWDYRGVGVPITFVILEREIRERGRPAPRKRDQGSCTYGASFTFQKGTEATQKKGTSKNFGIVL